MLSQNQILFGNQRLQEVAISWDVPILKAAKILASKGIDEFWKWINADEFLNFILDDEEEKKKFAKDCKIHEKPSEFIPEYYSGLNWKDAEHLVGKIIEYSDFPGKGWKVGKLKKLNKIDENFVVNTKKHCVFSTYIRTLSKHPTIHIGGVELPMPETIEPALGTKYWLSPANNVMIWGGYPYNISALKAGRVHLTEERAKAWSDWWKSNIIDKMK